ncbi:MAG: diguanylate cyclase, partial [Chloroflexi bacterium]|nr:diguanylate cyclase [Chloroflexota bacterium]
YTNSALRNSEERFRILYEANPSMYFTVSADGIILSVNQFGADELGYTIDDLVGQPIPSIFHPEDQMAVQQSLARCLQYPTELVNWEFREIRKDSAIMWVEGRARAVHDIDGELVVLIVCNNINERKHAEELLRHLASRDMLTNLANRAHFYTYMESALSQAALREQKMALLFLDLDRLKLINDTWGHIAGDKLLKMVAGRMQVNTPKQSVIARMGGDEFVILLEPLHNVRDAITIAQQVRDALSQPFIIHRREVFITCSIGISIYPNHGQETLVLLKNADAAM